MPKQKYGSRYAKCLESTLRNPVSRFCFESTSFLLKPNTQLRVNLFAAFAAVKDRRPAESGWSPISWNGDILPKSPRGE